jgi:dephospho-CoA kinase
MLRVGLTGGIASGKSLVSDRFARLGVAISDADRAARAVVAPESRGLAAVVEAFREEILAADGTLDRARLRERVFRDDAERERLEGILHPLIRERMDEQLSQAAAAGHRYAVGVVPLLVETGQAGRYDRVLVVDATTEAQRARLAARDGVDADRARRMLAAQAGRWQRLQQAHDAILNHDAVAVEAALACQVCALDRKYRRLADLARA